MNKFEKLIEYVINDDDKKAKALFHSIVVDKSRKIYEGLMDHDRMGGDQVDELLNDVEAEERGFHEDDDEMAMEPEMGMGDEMGMEPEMGMGDEMGGDDMMGMDAEEGELEDRVVDLEDKLDELMAEFDSIVGGDEGMGDEMGGDMEMEPEMDGDMEMEPEMEESRNPRHQRQMSFEDEDLDESIVDELHEEDDEDLDEGKSFYESADEDLDEGEEHIEEDTEDLDEADELEEALKAEIDENVSLTKVSKGIANKTEGQSVGAAGEKGVAVNKKTINNDNSGKKGALANPVNFTNSEHSNNAKISYKAGDSTTEPRQSNVKVPKNSEEGGTDKKSVIESKKRRGRPLGSKNKTAKRPTNSRRRV